MPHPDAVRLMQAFINPLEVVTFQTFDDTDAKSQELARISHSTLTALLCGVVLGLVTGYALEMMCGAVIVWRSRGGAL